MEASEIEQVIGAVAGVVEQVVETVVAQRMEEVYGALEQLREEMRVTVGVLDGNDQAIIARLMQKEGDVAVEYMGLAQAAWERFVKGEARAMGLKVIKEKMQETTKEEVE